jgi:hypothetical protein
VSEMDAYVSSLSAIFIATDVEHCKLPETDAMPQ